MCQPSPRRTIDHVRLGAQRIWRNNTNLFRPGMEHRGEVTGLAGDDSPLVLRDTGTEEIYALDWEAP